MVTRVVTVRRTEELDDATLAEVRALLDAAFEGDFGDEDWEHGLGGVHALLRVGGDLVAHGSLVPRTLWHGEVALRAGYVEAVAVDAAHRRRGHGDAVMAALEAHAPSYDVLALSASDDGLGLYRARGWQLWRGPSGVRSADGTVTPTPDDDGAVFVRPGAVPLDLDGPLACEWRPGDVW